MYFMIDKRNHWECLYQREFLAAALAEQYPDNIVFWANLTTEED